MDTIADMLTQIRNAGSALIPEITVAHSNIKESVARVMKDEGYIADCSVEGKGIKKLKIKLKFQGRAPVITGLRRVSTPGLRRYVQSTEIPQVLGGLGTSILSTSKGVMSGRNAKKSNLGGEVICFVW